MKTRYKILTFVILGITFVSTGFGALYLSPGLHPDENLPNVLEREFEILYNQKCARLFDKIFDTWQEHVKENYGGPGQPILEPPSVAGLIADWEGGEEFRNTNCRYTVNDWAYLVEHQDEVWGHVDWSKLEPFPYNELSSIEKLFFH